MNPKGFNVKKKGFMAKEGFHQKGFLKNKQSSGRHVVARCNQLYRIQISKLKKKK